MEKKASVIVRHLNAPYQEESRTHFKPLGAEMVKEIKTAVTEIFDKSGGENLLKESREVFIKPNGIDGQPYCYTRPEVVEAVIEYWKTHGAKKSGFLRTPRRAMPPAWSSPSSATIKSAGAPARCRSTWTRTRPSPTNSREKRPLRRIRTATS